MQLESARMSLKDRASICRGWLYTRARNSWNKNSLFYMPKLLEEELKRRKISFCRGLLTLSKWFYKTGIIFILFTQRETAAGDIDTKKFTRHGLKLSSRRFSAACLFRKEEVNACKHTLFWDSKLIVQFSLRFRLPSRSVCSSTINSNFWKFKLLY